ncbi:MAG: sodium:proline symporter [Bacteroidetes bacterium]|nr:sodium:proline symporter [Bacteroidota bacterium]
MVLNFWDWFVIVAFICLSLGIAFLYRKQGEAGLDGFFLGGRSMPWYLAGLSMVATTFAADTPLAVTELVAKNGIAGNWLWWNLLAGGLLTTIFFSRLWRRSGILTEVEFIQLRYSGKAASFLRGFKSVYLGLFINAMIIAWVNQAFMALVEIFFDYHNQQGLYLITGGAMLVIMFYSSVSGLKGIAVTDAFQFIIAMTGCIILAVLVLRSESIGGISGLKEKLPPGSLDFFPKIGGTESGIKTLSLSVITFLTYAGILWWASWYPGAEPGGGGYIAQRMMGTRSEKDAVFSTLFFQIAHYCLRPWPWIIVALCAVVLYPDLSAEDQKLGYVMAMRDYLPLGLRGLLLVAFLGAYMSTISTQLNWGASYLVNDLYQSYIAPPQKFKTEEQRDKNYILISRIATFIIMIVALLVTTQIKTITGVWEFIFQCGAGLGLVLILRWYWHRINVWSEISATLAPFLVYGFIMIRRNIFLSGLESGLTKDEIADLTSQVWYFDFAWTVILTVFITTVIWIAITFLTKPTSESILSEFFKRVQPAGIWGKYGRPDNGHIVWMFLSWLVAIFLVYSALFFIGEIVLQEWRSATLYGGTLLISTLLFNTFSRKAKLFS